VVDEVQTLNVDNGGVLQVWALTECFSKLYFAFLLQWAVWKWSHFLFYFYFILCYLRVGCVSHFTELHYKTDEGNVACIFVDTSSAFGQEQCVTAVSMSN
jgi:hypothetical protein